MSGVVRHGSLVLREDWNETEQDRVDRALDEAAESSRVNPQVWPERPSWWWWERFTASLDYGYPGWMWEERAQQGLEEFLGECSTDAEVEQ